MTDGPSNDKPLRVLASGGLEVWHGDERIDGHIPAKAALLIAYLADRSEPASRSAIAGLLWSDHSEEQARTSLRVTLTRMRQHVPHVQADRTTVGLSGPVEFDVGEIERGDVDLAMERYRGDLLAGQDVDGAALFDDWLARRREEHRTLVLRSLGAGARAAAEGARWDDLLPIARRMIEIERWNEPAHRHVMTALAATESRSAALDAFDQCTTILLDEFGVVPDDETEQLAEQIRAGTAVKAQDPGSAPATTERSIAWRLLGDVAVIVDGEERELGGRHRRSVMAYLALMAPQRCSFDELSQALWGDDVPATARQSIHRHIRELERLAPELALRIEKVPDGFRLTALPDEIDMHRVQAMIASARAELRHGQVEAGASGLREAVDSWGGSSLGGVTRHGKLGAARAALDELRFGAIEDVIEAELAIGHHREVASEAEAFALEHPSRSRAWANLMLSRARNGRQAAALAAYEAFDLQLAEEGLKPPPAVVALYHQILDEAPAIRAAEDVAPTEDLTPPTSTFSVPLPPSFERSTFVPLVGRDMELAQLTSAAASSEARTVLLAGEPGIGKTRLAAEIAKVAHAAGASVLYGRCDEALGAAYQPWAEALAHLADHLPPHFARRHLDRFGPSLQFLMPALSGHGARVASASDASQQELLFRATEGLLGDVAQRRPLVIVIDDMQWADPSTVELFRHLARHATDPILLLGLYRTTDVGQDHPLHAVIADLEQAAIATVVTLPPLDESARTALVRHLVTEEFVDFAPQIARQLSGDAGGNPFYFSELLRSLRESDAIGPLIHDERVSVVPPSIQRVVTDRVNRLGDSVTETLRTSSVFGREFDLGVLSLVLGRDEDDVLTDLEHALSAGLVNDAPLGRDRFAFGHDLVHHTLSATLSESRRCRIHGRIADATVEVHGDDLGDHLPMVATHLVAASDPSRRADVERMCAAAGRHAAGQLAPADAIAWFQRALDHLEDDDHQARSQLLVELGTQQRNAADPEHRTTLIEAGRLALAHHDTETLVAATLANSRGMNAHVWELDHERIEMLHAALDALGPIESAARAELLASLANEQWDDDHRDETEAFYREALTLARRVADTETLARVLVRVSRARNFRLDRAEMAEVSDELRHVATALDLTDPLLLANCLTTVLNTSIRLGLASETSSAIDAITDTADQLPLPMFTLPAHLAACLEAGLRGDITAYEQASEATFHHAVEIGDEEAGFIFEGQLFYTAYLRGDLAPLLDLSLQVMNERPEVGLYRAACTLIHTESGLVDQARAFLDTEVATGIEPSIDMFQIQALVAWADAAATLGHLAACEQLYDALAPLTTEMSGHLVQVGEPIDISLGRLATVLGRFSDAAEHFDRAQVIADGYSARWMDALTAASRAELLLERDPSLAAEQASRAHSIAEDAGYTAIASRARRVLDAADG